MCAKQSLKQLVGEWASGIRDGESLMLNSPIPENTIRSGYHSWRPSPRGSGRSRVRNDASRNALSGVKVSSPVKQIVPEWPSVYIVSDAIMASAAKATPMRFPVGYGMYRRLFQELGRSPWMISWRKSSNPQGVMPKWLAISRGEVRWFRSSEEVE